MVETSVRKIELPGICKHKLHGLFMGQYQCISTSTNLFGQQSELLCSATLSNATVTRHFVKGTYEITEVACNSKNSGSFARLLQLKFCSNRWHHVVKPLKDLFSWNLWHKTLKRFNLWHTTHTNTVHTFFYKAPSS
jgi:hypothetical protein